MIFQGAGAGRGWRDEFDEDEAKRIRDLTACSKVKPIHDSNFIVSNGNKNVENIRLLVRMLEGPPFPESHTQSANRIFGADHSRLQCVDLVFGAAHLGVSARSNGRRFLRRTIKAAGSDGK